MAAANVMVSEWVEMGLILVIHDDYDDDDKWR
jgi:hypothetical protein